MTKILFLIKMDKITQWTLILRLYTHKMLSKHSLPILVPLALRLNRIVLIKIKRSQRKTKKQIL